MNSTRLDRRGLLVAGGSGLAVFAAPSWIRGAFALQGTRSGEQPKSDVRVTIDRALERATAIGKPLMVIVVPEESLRLQRGRLWGDLFSFAPEAAMADFALCEWTCAAVADVERVLTKSKTKLTRETAAVLIETDVPPMPAQLVSFPLTDLEPEKLGGFPVDKMQARAKDLAGRLQKAILPEPEAWRRRQEQSLKACPLDGGELLLVLEPNVRPRLEAVDRHAAFLRAQIEGAPERRERCLAALAQAASRRLWDAEPPGATWKTEHVDPCPPCGMAQISGASRAFLEFYASKPR